MENKQSQCRERSGGDFESLFDKPLCYISIGDLNLIFTGTGVGELLALVGIVQVPPDGRHVFRDLKASVLLCHHLQAKKKKNIGISSCSVRHLILHIIIILKYHLKPKIIF